MKRIIFILIACFILGNASAQTSFQFRYWFDENYSSYTDSFSVSGTWQISVESSHLSEGFHTLYTQVKDTSGVWFSPQSYLFYRLPDTIGETTVNYTCWFDQDYDHKRIGAFVSEHLLFDIDSFPTGFHTLNFQFGEGFYSTLKSYLFYKKPHAEIQITKYEYWFNDLDSLRSTISFAPQDTVNFVALLQTDTFPIRSTSFHFNPNGGTPVVNAKNEIHFRYYNVEDRYASKAIPYIDITVSDTIHADTLERDTTKTIPAPRNNGIHWFKLMAGVGDSLSFHTDRPCTLQLFASSGKEVFSANGTDVLSWTGCHAWESGDYYLAVHDAEDTGTISISYQWIYRYAVLKWNVHRVGNGGLSTITFEGNGFANLDTVFLIKGSDSIPALYINRESNTTTSIIFNFENVDTGMYHAKFNYVDESLNKSNIVTVENAIPIALTSTCSYPPTFWRGSTVTYTYEITNTGNMTAYKVPLYVYIGTPSRNGITHIDIDGLKLPLITQNWNLDSLSTQQKNDVIEWAIKQGDDYFFEKYIDIDSISGDSLFIRANYFIVNVVPYERLLLEINITAIDSVDVWVGFPNSISPISFSSPQTPVFNNPKSSTNNALCCAMEIISCEINLKSTELSVASFVAACTGVGIPESIALSLASCVNDNIQSAIINYQISHCLGAPSSPKDFLDKPHVLNRRMNTIIDCASTILGPLKKIKDILSIISTLGDGFNLGTSINDFLNGGPIPSSNDLFDLINCASYVYKKDESCCSGLCGGDGGGSMAVQAVDPNDIIGYTAESGSHAVGEEQNMLPYLIEFENDTVLATAHAHTVVVRDTLDGNAFDLNSFAATALAIGDEVTAINREQHFTRTVDMRPAIEALAQVQLDYRIDTTFAVATWTFTSLDPMTLQPTVADSLGFLRIGGTGEVDFTINRKADLPDSTLIDNRAWITFDNEEPIATSTWRNIIDNTPPVSNIDSIAYTGSTTTVTITATDNLSGVWRYNVYALMDGDVMLPMAMNVPIDSAAVFTTPDEVVQFRSVAIDSAGNVEPLTLTPLVTTIYDTLTMTACDNYTWGDSIYSASGEYTQNKTATIRNTPDTITTLYLTIHHSTSNTESVTACDSYTWHGSTYTASTNTPTYQTTNVQGCDSTITLHLTINNSSSSTKSVTACDNYTWHGSTYTASTNTPTFTITNAAGCDSTVTLHLTVNHSTDCTETATACDNYTWHGSTYTASTNTPSFTTTNATGCDSTVTLHLTINHSTTATETVTACDSYTWHDSTYTTSTNAPSFTTTNAVGCDSTVTLHLTINLSTTATESITACDSYTWHGTTFTASNNTSTYQTTNAVGCDSTVTLHLTINNSSNNTETVTACDSYTWHGNTFTASTNTPTYQTTNAAGCDSTVTLQLTINYSTDSTETVTACDSYTWNGNTYTISSTDSITSINAAGCDSTASLNLTINYSQATAITAAICEGESYLFNGNNLTTAGHYSDTLPTSLGCDSVLTLALTVNPVSETLLNESACDSYTWIDGSTYTASTNEPSFTTLNQYGCDSTVTLHLTIHYSSHDTIVDSAAGSYVWQGETFTESGEYLFEGLTEAGCDSIIVLRLTITELGITAIDEMGDISLYPNPTTGKLTIDGGGVARVEVYDPSGRIVATFSDCNTIDIQHLPSGSYTLHVTLQGGSAVKRVVKQ